jgi:phosphate/sulfate permease
MSDSPAGYSTAPDRPADAGGVRNDILLALVVVTALSFDFTNGFHDTGNAMATSIATKALSPRIAVALSGVLNLVGAFLSLSVAATIASGLVNTGLVTLTVVFAGLAGGITWNLLTWLLGIPSSSSHALIGGVIGSTIAAAGGHAVQWHDLFAKVIIPAGLSPIIAALVAGTGTWLLYRISWRVIRTLGKGLVEIEAPQGMADESASAAVILLSSHFGYSLSTTHVATGSIIGTGLGKKGAEVRWNVAGRMATAWVFTLPSAAVVGAGTYFLAHAMGGNAGVTVDLVLLLAVAGTIYLRSRQSRVGHDNVNSDWTGSAAPVPEATSPEPAAA